MQQKEITSTETHKHNEVKHKEKNNTPQQLKTIKNNVLLMCCPTLSVEMLNAASGLLVCVLRQKHEKALKRVR